MKLQYLDESKTKATEKLEKLIKDFYERLKPIEKEISVYMDGVTGSLYCECHVKAESLVQNATKDAPLDPEEQSAYKANRDIVEDNAAFQQMKQDALLGRTFSNIVTEFMDEYDPDHPLKIIGGQHRYEAILDAYNAGINQYHGIKVYFCLDVTQRLDAQLISNTNIEVSSDLLDRMMETVKGPQLRNWCHETGLLSEGADFADKKKRGKEITVREARTFIMNYINGRNEAKNVFERTKTNCVLATTGGIDDEWEKMKQGVPNIWKDEQIKEAGRQYALLISKQQNYYSDDNKEKNRDYANKASNYAVLASWAYVAGLLSCNKVRLKRHYELVDNCKKDPLSAELLSKARHKSDPINYRGLGTRTDVKERGRLVELFYLQAEKGTGITKPLIDAAISRYFAKLANIDVLEAEKRI